MSRSLLVTGARVVLYINGSPYAAVTGFRWDPATPGKPLIGLDVGTPVEIAPQVTRVTGTIQLLRQVGDGGAEGAGVVPAVSEISAGRYFSLMLIERSTSMVLFRADNCWPMGQNWEVGARGRMTGSLSFEALDWTNEVTARK